MTNGKVPSDKTVGSTDSGEKKAKTAHTIIVPYKPAYRELDNTEYYTKNECMTDSRSSLV